MRSFYLSVLFIVLGLVVNAQTYTTTFKNIGKEIQKKFAPDKRTIFYSMQIKAASVFLETSSEQVVQEFEKVMPTMSHLSLAATLLPSKTLNGLEYGVANISVANNLSLIHI